MSTEITAVGFTGEDLIADLLMEVATTITMTMTDATGIFTDATIIVSSTATSLRKKKKKKKKKKNCPQVPREF